MARTVIERVRDRDKLLAVLVEDRVRNAYQIGSLAPGYLDYTRHYWMTQEGEPQAIITVYDGLSAPALFAWGAADNVARLIERLEGQLPGRMFFHRYPEYGNVIGAKLKVRSARKESRMILRAEEFKADSSQTPVLALGHRDTAAIIGLYANYPDNFFEPYQLESGYYFGLKEGDQLVSVAGIHMVSEPQGLAMLGNVVTAPSVRGKGYARVVTSALCSALFDTVDLLALDVPTGSTAARHTFEALGFKTRFHYEQALLHKGTGWLDDD